MHLLLFSHIHLNYLNDWQRNFQRQVSEILCVEENLPKLARISFPKLKDHNQKQKYSQAIMVEFFTSEKVLSNDQILKVKDYLHKLLNFEINFLGTCYGRPIYNLSEINKIKAEEYLNDLTSDIQLEIPNIYWGPINMSKCGIRARSSQIKFLIAKFYEI